MRRVVTAALVLTAACGPKRPPADFAPDPGLLAQIRELRISTNARACPGETFGALYTAVLEDGSLISFESRYDDKHPPRLHVVFLERRSEDATPLENGAWSAEPDPLWTAMNGFRLTATLHAKPAISATTVVAPDYRCLPHAFGFRGAGAGASGPQVTVRLGILQSPFYPRLLVAGIEVEDAPPFFVLADASAVPPSDWLIVESRGARGARGADGQNGTAGAAGQDGCPGTAGGPGGAGGNGSAGGPGGRGGQITIIAPSEEPFLAGLIDARVPGGEGGPGGASGKGGAGGKGGAASPANDPRCTAGVNGTAGRPGVAGPDGRDGAPGARPQTLTVPTRDIWGTRVPPPLAELINYRPRPR
ncbi:MAG TPA: hypothetical protein VGQ06_10085 [Gemmatimonadales bacterium]|jgi:hypothetical protein|nr:hypothetical protein [Gemmatimonadales bacterium]